MHPNFIVQHNSGGITVNFKMHDANTRLSYLARKEAIKDLMSHGKDKIDSTIEELVKEKFLHHVKLVSEDCGKTLREHCKLSEFHCSMGHLFMSNLEDRVTQFLANHPHDEELKAYWRDFRICYARYLSTDSETFVEVSKRCLNNLHEKLVQMVQFDPLISVNFLERENALKTIFEIILDTDVHLLGVPVAVLAEISALDKEGSFEIATFLDPLIRSHNDLLKSLSHNIPWVVEHCTSQLASYSSSPCIPIKEAADAMLEKLKFLKEKILPNLLKMAIKHLKPNKNFEVLKGISCFFNESLLSVKEDNPSPEPKNFNPETKDQILRCNLSSSFDPTSLDEMDLEKVKFNIQKNEYIALREKAKMNNAWLDQTIEDLDQIIKFKEEQQECIRLLDAFITQPYTDFFVSAEVVDRAIHSSKSKALLRDYSATKNRPKNQPKKEDDRDIIKLTKAIEGSSKVKNKRSRKRKNAENPKPAKDASKKSSPQKLDSPEKAPTPSSSQISQPPISSTQAQPISQFTRNLTVQSQNPFEKNAARHANMYFEDLIAASQGLNSSTQESSKRFYLIMILQSAFFYLEQMLTYERLKLTDLDNRAFRGHNLKYLLEEIGCSSIKKELPRELFLANYWTKSPYEQLEKRSDWNVPLVLKKIQAIYEGKSSKNVIRKIKNYIDRIKLFTLQLPSFSEHAALDIMTIPVDSKTIPQTIKFEIEKYMKIKEICQSYLSDTPLFLEPTIKQAICHIDLIKGCLEELNKEEISSESFSFLVRALIFWENTVLEEILQTLFGLKTGIISQSHDILDLTRSIHGELNPDIESVINKHFTNVHNISRYPFTAHQGSNKIRRLILQSEFIRERPELATGFELEKNLTQLNYIEIKKKFDFEHTLSKLRKHSDKVFHMIEGLLSEFSKYH